MKLQSKRTCFATTVFATFLCAQSTFGGQPTSPGPVFIPPPIGGIGPVFVPPIGGPAVVPTTPGPATVSTQATRAITGPLNNARTTCAQVPTGEYTIDCLGDALEELARNMSDSGDYAEAKVAIAQAGQKLRSLAQDNASSELPRGHIRQAGAGGKRASFTPLTPVRTDTLAQSNAQAAAILAEAETILLRSAANSAARKVHYQQIAQALGSSKVLLRS